MITKKEVELLHQAYLPKWPMLFMNGKDISPDQAEEIIRRNDRAFVDNHFGNDRDWEDYIRETCQIPTYSSLKDISDYFETKKKWNQKWATVGGEYIATDWIACCVMSGPYGWVDINGKIFLCHNIGKWPSTKDVYRELRTLAQTWPFLEMAATLYGQESGDAKPEDAVISFHVKNGIVRVVDPREENIHEQYGISFVSERVDEDYLFERFHHHILSDNELLYERAPWVTPEIIQKWANQVFKK